MKEIKIIYQNENFLCDYYISKPANLLTFIFKAPTRFRFLRIRNTVTDKDMININTNIIKQTLSEILGALLFFETHKDEHLQIYNQQMQSDDIIYYLDYSSGPILTTVLHRYNKYRKLRKSNKISESFYIENKKELDADFRKCNTEIKEYINQYSLRFAQFIYNKDIKKLSLSLLDIINFVFKDFFAQEIKFYDKNMIFNNHVVNRHYNVTSKPSIKDRLQKLYNQWLDKTNNPYTNFKNVCKHFVMLYKLLFTYDKENDSYSSYELCESFYLNHIQETNNTLEVNDLRTLHSIKKLSIEHIFKFYPDFKQLHDHKKIITETITDSFETYKLNLYDFKYEMDCRHTYKYFNDDYTFISELTKQHPLIFYYFSDEQAYRFLNEIDNTSSNIDHIIKYIKNFFKANILYRIKEHIELESLINNLGSVLDDSIIKWMRSLI